MGGLGGFGVVFIGCSPVFVGVYGDEENQAMWLSVMMPVSSVRSSTGSAT